MARVLQCDANRNLIEKFKQESPDKETPEQVWFGLDLLFLFLIVSCCLYNLFVWLLLLQRLVRMTITHPRYPIYYAFPSHAEVINVV